MAPFQWSGGALPKVQPVSACTGDQASGCQEQQQQQQHHLRSFGGTIAAGLQVLLGVFVLLTIGTVVHMQESINHFRDLVDELRRDPVSSSLNGDLGAGSFEGGGGSAAEARRLMYTVGRNNHGCFEIDDNSAVNIDVAAASCNGKNCPACFITPTNLGQETTLTIQNCATHRWGIGTGGGTSRTGVWQYTFINKVANQNLKVSDGTATYTLPQQSHVTAYCDDAGTNRLYFPSTTLPTLTVDSGLTLSGGTFDISGASGAISFGNGAVTFGTGGVTIGGGGFTLSGGNFAMSGGGTFTTTTGDATFAGDVIISGTKSLSVGGTSTLSGNVVVGASGSTATTTLWGQTIVKVNGFEVTAGGAVITADGLTVTDGGFTLSGGAFNAGGSGGAFTTSSGAVTLSGDTTVDGTKTFTVGSTGTAGSMTKLFGGLQVGGSTGGHEKPTALYGATTVQVGGVDIAGGNFAMSGSSQTFSTGDGDVSLAGDTTVTGTKTFTVGSSGTAGSATILFGGLQVGANGADKPTSLYGATTVQSAGLTIAGGNFAMSGSSQTFSTGDGAVTLNGATTVAGTNAFTVGTSGTTGSATILYGTLQVGDSGGGGNSKTTTLNGGTTVAIGGLTVTAGGFRLAGGNFDASGHAGTFETSTGDHTFNGLVKIADGKNFQVGVSDGAGGTTTLYGTLTVGTDSNPKAMALTGATTVKGDLTLNSGNFAMSSGSGTFDLSGSDGAFTTTTGAVVLKGDTTVFGSKTFTVGADDDSAGQTTLYGNVVVGSATNSKTSTMNGKVTVVKNGLLVSHGGVEITGNSATECVKASSCQGTFVTSTGANTISGAATFSESLTVDTGKGTTLNGHVYIGGSTNVRSLITYANIQNTGTMTNTGDFTINGDTITCTASEGSTSDICTGTP